MKLRNDPPLHLTYCLNAHPGETWEENFAAIREKTLRVRELVGRSGNFGLGLRLSRAAAKTLAARRQLEEFRDFCGIHDLYVFTINGFPYGAFHGKKVKTAVYLPDWRSRERLEYTNALTDILAALLPEGVDGSISTVPGTYKNWMRTTADVQSITENLVRAAVHAADTFTRTDKKIAIALEPEPDCLLGNINETIAFFKGPLREFGISYLRRARGLSPDGAASLLARHIGICFDTTHMAVEFENLTAGLKRLRDAGVPVCKIQLGAALSVRRGADAANALRQFCEPVYLHQTRIKKHGGEISSFPDLPPALASAAGPGEKWRIHFHLPFFFRGSEALVSTRALLTPRFARLICAGITEQLEIETYTYNVLPVPLTVKDTAAGIAREYEWILHKLLRHT